MRERGIERGREGGREGGRERERERVREEVTRLFLYLCLKAPFFLPSSLISLTSKISSWSSSR